MTTTTKAKSSDHYVFQAGTLRVVASKNGYAIVDGTTTLETELSLARAKSEAAQTHILNALSMLSAAKLDKALKFIEGL